MPGAAEGLLQPYPAAGLPRGRHPAFLPHLRVRERLRQPPPGLPGGPLGTGNHRPKRPQLSAPMRQPHCGARQRGRVYQRGLLYPL